MAKNVLCFHNFLPEVFLGEIPHEKIILSSNSQMFTRFLVWVYAVALLPCHPAMRYFPRWPFYVILLLYAKTIQLHGNLRPGKTLYGRYQQ